MKILIAGSSGAIGLPLMRMLVKEGHEVYGMTQSPNKTQLLKDQGAHPLVVNILNEQEVLHAVIKVQPDVVIDMLTRLPAEYTPDEMQKAAPLDAQIRLEGGGYLFKAAEAAGVLKYIAQSTGFWYQAGKGLADEKVPLAEDASPGIKAGVKVYEQIEKRVLGSKSMEGIALRFGFYYGPGTWFVKGGNMADQILKQQFPMIGEGEGVWSFVHIEDAARATASAIHAPAGIYNIINDEPSPLKKWLFQFAEFLNAPPPPQLTNDDGLKLRGEDGVYCANYLRGASNKKAKELLNFKPKSFVWE